jgi:O-antigen/teichoic acid export membrane protein
MSREIIVPEVAPARPRKNSGPKMSRSIILNYLAMTVGGVVAFLLTPILIHGLGDFNYGMWILVASIMDYYGLADMGIRFTLQRHVARYKGSDEQEALVRTFATALALSLVIAALTLIVTAVLSTFLPGVFHLAGGPASEFRRVLILLGISFAIGFPAKVLGAFLCGLQRFDLYNLAAIINTVLQAILLIGVLHQGYGIQGCAIVTLGLTVLSLAMSWKFVKMAEPDVSVPWQKASWQELRELFHFGIYIFVNQIGDLMRFRLDSFVIARWLNIALVTPFNVASRLIEYFRFVASGIVGPLITEMSNIEGQGRDEDLKQLFFRSTRWTTLLCLLTGSLLCLNGRALLTLWVGRGYAASYTVLVVLCVARVAAVLQSPSMSLLLARGRHKVLGWWTLLEGVANLVLSIYWAPTYGIVGVAMGTAVPMLAVRILIQPWYTLWVAKVSFYDYFVESLARPLAVFALFLAGVQVGRYLPHNISLISFAFTNAWQIALFALLTYAIGFTAGERDQLRQRVKRIVAPGRRLSPAPESQS